MHTVNLSDISPDNEALAAKIARRARVNLTDCYQCGKCSAGCPMADAMDLKPQQIVRRLQMGLVDDVLQAKSPWICAGCLTCSARCPQSIEIADLMQEVRRASKDAHRRPVAESDIFEDLFIKKVRARGVSNEQYLAAFYNLKSGHLLQDMDNAPLMMAKGLVGLVPHNSPAKEKIKRVIDRAEASDAERRTKE